MSQTTIVVAEETTAVEAPAAGETGHTTETTGHDGGHTGAFPPMDATTFPSQIFWLVIFFGLLYLLMSKLALPKMAAVLEKRHKTIEGDLAKASALKNETQAAVQAYEKALADARAKAQGIAAETRAKMNAEMEAERAALEKKIGAKTADAEAKIAAAKASAMKDVGEVAAETAAEIVSELTGATVSKAEAAKAIAGLKA
ncbi:F0F1 ATP synthase subunit B [Aestuariivirga sp.]|jgi:F-type H+-transporting ATPase subunit b|uniref:F0F1 ATP synthase subunit B n=1 Tax=Aestuariivirga sp. TaxID=2650926 RepID=UPI003782F326